MEWAKNRPAPTVDLAGSNLLSCTLEDLPGAREALELSGESPNGYPPLLEAIAARYGVETGRVATAGGCSGANFLTLAALVGTDDEVLVETPGYDPLPAAVTMLGGRVTRFERRFEEGYALDCDRIAEAATLRTRLVVVSNPHNPSGALASREEIAELGRLAQRRRFDVLVDEVYLDLVRGESPPPAATLSPAFVSTNSLTKAYGLSSLRCGWALASPEIAERIRRARDVVDVSGPIPAERLAVVAFRNLGRLAERARRLMEPNSRLVAEFLASRQELESVPSVTTVAFPRFRDGRDAGRFAGRLFEDHGVAVVPGSFFGAPSHFRVALGGATQKLEAGLAAIAACLSR
jgi:aspartate/methionine/tyrosine aminotransferase